jgi:amino acid adenylation domain-containing protein
MLLDWNATSTPAPRTLFPTAFAAAVERSPDALAVTFGAQSLSYRDVYDRVIRLAQHLRTLGVGPEVRVGLWLPRSPDMLVALLATLEAGGAYVPVDPAYPIERVELILRDAHARVLISTHALADGRAGSESMVYIEDSDLSRGPPPENAESTPRFGADTLAYILYTSGSTGPPNGVMVSHGSLMHYLEWCLKTYGLDAGDTSLVHSSIGFDLTITSLLPPLLVGGRVHLVPEGPGVEPLAEALDQDRNVALIKITPAHLEALGKRVLNSQSARVRTVIIGGEALNAENLSAWRSGSAPPRLINEYGPTEATVGCCIYEVAASDSDRGSVPIGRPIDNTQLYVCDTALQPVPVGVIGELYIGGAGLARGYAAQPALTAERFVPDPFGTISGSRLYRTGDLARYRADGTLEFLGRADHQVKIRGFRVEPAEVEARLVEHAAVDRVRVVAEGETSVDRRLVAHVALDRAYVLPESARQTLMQHRLTEWETVFDGYDVDSHSTSRDPRFNTSGWLDSYRRRPIPEAEMRVWAEDIAQRILASRPARVFDIGCGNGLLLFQIAPATEEYLATDFSRSALAYVRDQMAAEPRRFAHVALRRQAADDFDGIPSAHFDTVILSSVVQYFPDAEYLRAVLQGCARVVRPGGAIVVADVRSHRLDRAFHTSVQYFRAEDNLSVADLRRQIDRQVELERELCLDPEFFQALRAMLPAITTVEHHLQRGRVHNELCKYRYTVVLRVGASDATPTRLETDVVDGAHLSTEAIRELVATRRPGSVRVNGLRNARLTRDLELVDELPTMTGRVRDMRRALLAPSASPLALDPEDVWAIGCDQGYHVELCWNVDDPGRFDALLSSGPLHNLAAPSQVPLLASSAYASTPLRSRFDAHLVPEWRAYLARHLPGYMIPSTFVLHDALPLTAHGKVDRQALAALTPSEVDITGSPEPASSSHLEEELCRIFAELLVLDHVTVDDDFFDLGGHSLLAYRVVTRVRQRLGVDVPLTAIFGDPTVRGLARWILAHSVPDEAPLPDCVVTLQASGAQPPLFLAPPASGSPMCYAVLAAKLDADRPVYGFLSPGLGSGEEVLTSVDQVAARFVDALRRVQPHGPYHLGGWSFGGLVACEMASQLEQQRQHVALLALLDGGVYDVSQLSNADRVRLIVRLPWDALKAIATTLPHSYAELRLLAQWVGISLPESAGGLRRRDLHAQWSVVQELCAGSLRSLRVGWANTCAGISYSPTSYTGLAVLFRTDLNRRSAADPLVTGTRKFARGGLQVYPSPGTHLKMVLDQAHATELGRQLRESLIRASQQSRSVES